MPCGARESGHSCTSLAFCFFITKSMPLPSSMSTRNAAPLDTSVSPLQPDGDVVHMTNGVRSTERSLNDWGDSSPPLAPDHFFHILNHTMPSGSYPFYPGGNLSRQYPALADAFKEFEVSEPGFVKEMRDMEGKGWITRATISWFKDDFLTEALALRVSDVDYHLPGPMASTSKGHLKSNLDRPRPSTVWRMLQDDLLPPSAYRAVTTKRESKPCATPSGAEDAVGPTSGWDLKRIKAAGATAVVGTATKANVLLALLAKVDTEKQAEVLNFEAMTREIYEPVDTWRARLNGAVQEALESLSKQSGRAWQGAVWDDESRSKVGLLMLDERCLQCPTLGVERKQYEAQGYAARLDWDPPRGKTPAQLHGVLYVPGDGTTAESIDRPFPSAYSPRVW